MGCAVGVGVSVLLLVTVVQISTGCTVSDPGPTVISALSGASVLLSCSCADPRSQPGTLRWILNPGLNHTEIVYSDGTVHSSYTDRVRLFNSVSPGNLSLLLSHLTERDQGDYRCEGSGSSYRDISLTVTEQTSGRNPTSLYTGVIVATVLLCVAVLMVLLGTAVILSRKRAARVKKDRESSPCGEEEEEKEKEEKKQEEENDAVMYTTVGHSNVGRVDRRADRQTDTENSTEYAAVRFPTQS
ncbi:polymeric immunoglobulin receptor [Amia ocellicauda]|uniref:polymeric immunoglobulin receptor n=1 Tax=Amia ocellicauda TaxID=2972642 RepID=UPI003464902D